MQSWTALSASLSISLTSGGSTSVIWGTVGASRPGETQADSYARAGDGRRLQLLYCGVFSGVSIRLSYVGARQRNSSTALTNLGLADNIIGLQVSDPEATSSNNEANQRLQRVYPLFKPDLTRN